MMYPYITLADETEIIHSQIMQDADGTPSVIVHFERPTETGFDTARCSLPSYKWIKRGGFTDQEIAGFEEYLRCECGNIMEVAESCAETEFVLGIEANRKWLMESKQQLEPKREL